MVRGMVEEKGLFREAGVPEGGGKAKGGREAVCGETTLPETGLVGERKLGGKEGEEVVHRSTCSGLIGGLVGLVGRGLGVRLGCEETEGEEAGMRLVGVLVLSLGVGASVALDWGLLAALLPPGELAVAVLPSDVP